MASQVADYEITRTVLDDGVVPCLSARRPQRLGGGDAPVTLWVLGPLARTPWAAARASLETIAAVRSEHLPAWLEAGTGEWAQRPVIWVSASTPVTATLASPPPGMPVSAQLRAIAAAARGAHALHESGVRHGAICPQAIALLPPTQEAGDGLAAAVSTGTDLGAASFGAAIFGAAILGPASLANGRNPVAQIGYPPLGYTDPQLLRGEGGRWSDIWSLGATLHRALTGSIPFPGIDDMPVVEALSRLLAGVPSAEKDIPPAVAPLVTSCLSSDPADRPSTAKEVAERLDEAAAQWKGSAHQ